MANLPSDKLTAPALTGRARKRKPRHWGEWAGFRGWLMTGQQGCGGWGAARLAFAALKLELRPGKTNYTLVYASDLKGQSPREIGPGSRLSISQAEPLWCLNGRLTIQSGKGKCRKYLKRLCSFCASAGPGDRVTRTVGSIFFSTEHAQQRIGLSGSYRSK